MCLFFLFFFGERGGELVVFLFVFVFKISCIQTYDFP